MQQEATNRPSLSNETIHVGPTEIRFLITGTDSSGSIAMFEFGVPHREKLAAPPHSHDSFEETNYGIEGVLTWTVDGKDIELGPGQALCIRRGQVHSFANNGAVDVRALAVVTPAVIGPEFFREMSATLTSGLDMPATRAKMVEVMLRHGLTPVLPISAS